MPERDTHAVVLRARGLVLRLDDGGTVVSAVDPRRPGTSWLARAGDLRLETHAGPLSVGPPQLSVGVDEVEVEHVEGGLRAAVRHTVDDAWTVRVVLANESDTELTLEQVVVGWQPAPGVVVAALAAGAQASYAVQPADGEGPVLLGRLRAGAQAGVDCRGLLLGPLVLGPHHRWAAQWRWEVLPDPRRADLAGELPRTPWLELGQSVSLPGGPDVAVVAPGLAVEVEDERVEVSTTQPGRYRVELRSARGTTGYALSWAPDLDDLVDVECEAVLAGPTTPVGTVRLRDAASGLLVQDALRRRSLGSADELGDALELLGGLLVEEIEGGGPAPDPLALAFLAREADRAARTTLLDAAAAGLLAWRSPVRGLGLAGVGIALARVRGGDPGVEVVAHLGTLLGAAAPVDEAGLELALLLRPRGAAGDALLPGLWRLGAGLGAGLPGQVVPERDLESLAHASTLLGLVDEGTGQHLRSRWGIPVSELARRTAAQTRARLAEGDPGPAARRALAWLVLGRPSG